MTTTAAPRRRNLEDAPEAERASLLERYNRNRLHIHPTRKALTLLEFTDRCAWMAIYRDTCDADERERIVAYLQEQDAETVATGDFPSEWVPMPDRVRELLAALTKGSRGFDEPHREFR